MKAAVLNQHGPAEELKIIDLPIPRYGPNDVLVKVKAFALNRLDIWTRDGMPSLNIEFPHIGGSDFSGVIEEMGSDVKDVNIGDRIVVNPGISCDNCGPCNLNEQSLCSNFKLLGEHVWGGAAEYAVVPKQNIMKLPDNIEFTTAAATSLTALTSYRMIKTQGKLRQGETVLVIGAGGGIGTMAVQIAEFLGGKVVALTSSAEKMKKMKEIGAEHTINYKEDPNWSKSVWIYTEKKGVDLVIDSTGEIVFSKAIRSLAKGGRYVTCGATSGVKGEINLALLFWKQLSIIGSTMANHEEFIAALNLLFRGEIAPVIDTIYQFEEIQAAHKRLEDPNHIGKIVIEL